MELSVGTARRSDRIKLQRIHYSSLVCARYFVFMISFLNSYFNINKLIFQCWFWLAILGMRYSPNEPRDGPYLHRIDEGNHVYEV